MLKNNNMAVVSRMAKKSLKSSRGRSVSMILAVLLSSMMLFSVFTVGITYFKMFRLQNIRLYGSESDAILYGVSNRQTAFLQEHPNVETFGIIALSGYVEETACDKTPDVILAYGDPVYWEEIMAPARESVSGAYPKADDELMVTKDALEKCGFPKAEIGDSLTFIYSVRGTSCEKTFRISGFWDGYGSKDLFYVSKAFYDQTGLSFADVSSGRCHIRFRQNVMTQSEQDSFREALELDKRQDLLFMTEGAVQILTGIFCLSLVICLCAYLLIYNIMYLSIAGNIRYYGLLQTIGMTGRQIYGLMRRRMFLVAGIGLGLGLLLGGGLSFFLIPAVVRSLGIRASEIGGIEISFHPIVFLLTILLTAATVSAAGRKPAKIAVMCSPMEALGYRPASSGRKKQKTLSPAGAAHPDPGSLSSENKRLLPRRTPHRRPNLIWRMAKGQLIKDWKKSLIVMLSLAASLSVFLCVTTLLRSQGAREFYSNFRNLDMILRNDTVRKEDLSEHAQIFDSEFFEKLNKLEGISGIDCVIYKEVTVPWEPDFADQWMREFYDRWMDIPYEDDIAEYKEYPENFGTTLIGLSDADFQALNETMPEPVDGEAFLKGESCLLYRNNLAFEDKDAAGKTITCAQYDDPQNTLTFEIAGFTDISSYNAMLGFPPVILVSDSVVKNFAEDPVIYKIGITYTKAYDMKTEQALLSIADEIPRSKDYSYDSRIELMENVKKAQGGLAEVGFSIVLILTFIGLMNYINTFAGNIQSRQRELSVMESIGMTDRQKNQLLSIEGILYATGAWLITMTAGLGVDYCLFQSMNYMDAPFSIPLLPVLAAAVLTFLLCIAVPVASCRQAQKGRPVVERIKGIE